MESHTNQTAKRSIHHDALIAAQQKVVLAAQNALDAQKEILQIYMKNATADTRKVKRSKVDDGRPKKLSGYLLFCKEKVISISFGADDFRDWILFVKQCKKRVIIVV